MSYTTSPSAGLTALRNRYYIAVLTISFLFSFISAPLFSLLQVYVDRELLRPPLFSGVLNALFRIFSGIFAIPAGVLCDMLGVKRVFVLGILGPLLASTLFLTGNPFLLTGLCIGLGVAWGFSNTGGQSYLLGSVSSSALGIASAGYFLGTTLGTASGNLFAGPIADSMGYRALGTIACAASVCLFVGALVFLPSLRRSGKNVRFTSRSFAGYIELLRRREVRLLLGFSSLRGFYWGAAVLLIPLLISRLSGTNTSASTYTALSFAAAGVFQILTGRLCDRIGRWRPILTALACITVSAVGLALAGHTLLGLYVFGILGAASHWSLTTATPGLLQLTAREGEEGRVVGINYLTGSAGILFGNLGGGKLVEWGPAFPFGLAAALCMGAVLCGAGLHRLYRATDFPSSAFSR